MKKQNLSGRILLPVIIILLLLPPLSCLIFQQTAKSDALQNASHDLTALQSELVPLMDEFFPQNSSVPQGPEKIRDFLLQSGKAVHRMDGEAKLIILASEMQMIYPRDEEERTRALPLSEELAKYIQSGDVPTETTPIKWTSHSGENFLVSFYKVPAHSPRIAYFITYCPTSPIISWVRHASILVLSVSSVFALFAIIIIWLTTCSINRQLHRLCQRTQGIGKGDFSEIQASFSIRELEELRLAMNEMSHQLLQSEQVQKDFFQNVSHELRNPLMSISGYAQGIEQGVFSSPAKAAHTILEESNRLTELVNSLLTLSRMESRKHPPMLRSIPVLDSVEDCLDRVHGLAMQKGIACSLLPLNQDFLVRGEEELLERILDNLLTNAIRYAKKEVLVKVSQTQNKIFISVLDDGNGIAEKDLPHLFERCYKGKGGNFGLGLSIARTAALSMDGKLSAANSPEGGALFTLTLSEGKH